jgi:hypothetical protein
VQILIDQMANNPDDFFGPVGESKGLSIRRNKFATWASVIENELIPGARLEREKEGRSYIWFLSDEEKAALAEAYTEARKVRFDAEIVFAMADKPVADPYADIGSVYATNLGANIAAVNAQYTNNLMAENTIGVVASSSRNYK